MARKKKSIVTAPQNAIEFMEYFGSTLACYKEKDEAASGMKVAPIDDLRRGLLGDLYGLKKDSYFIVNPGGTKVKDIVQPVACYIDLDAGRNAKKEYLSTREVDNKKKEMDKKILAFSKLSPALPMPTAIVETRNGFQLYWKLTGSFSVRQWNTVQKKIAHYFKDVGADAKVLKANQILRLPFTTWFKTYEKGSHKPFDVTLYAFTGKEYGFYDLADTVKDFPQITGSANHANWSYGKPSKVYTGNKGYTPVPRSAATGVRKTTNRKNNKANGAANVDAANLAAECKDFLLEISNQLPYKGMQFSATQAKRLAEQLSVAFHV